jgi:hypothetical protein
MSRVIAENTSPETLSYPGAPFYPFRTEGNL